MAPRVAERRASDAQRREKPSGEGPRWRCKGANAGDIKVEGGEFGWERHHGTNTLGKCEAADEGNGDSSRRR